MCENDTSYYRRRAETELEQAQRATKPEVVRIHFELSQAYLERLEYEERADQTLDA